MVVPAPETPSEDVTDEQEEQDDLHVFRACTSGRGWPRGRRCAALGWPARRRARRYGAERRCGAERCYGAERRGAERGAADEFGVPAAESDVLERFA